MTQPDELLPDNAANATSFSSYAAKSQEEYEDEFRGAEETRWGGGILDWFLNLLPAQILEPFQELVDALVTLLGRVPIVGPIISQLAEMFGFMNDDTMNAQGSADNANTSALALSAQLAALIADAPPGTMALSDNFDRTDTDLGSDWTEVYESGSGSMNTDGNNAYWDSAGGGSRVGRARYNTALTSDYQLSSIVVTGPKNYNSSDPSVMLVCRSDAAMDNLVIAWIYHNFVEIGYYVSGTYTRIGATEAVPSASGDSWELRAGTATDERQFLLYRNGSLVCDRTDTGDVSLMGASYRYAGFGMQAGTDLVPFIGFVQKPPPSIQGWAAADRTP